MEIVPDDEGFLAFDNAIDLETGLRPLRLKVANYLTALFNRAPDSKLPPAQLAALAGNLHSIVTRVHGFVSLSPGPFALTLKVPGAICSTWL